MTNPVQIRVLGNAGRARAGFFAPSLLIDERILLDAGAFGLSLSLEEQLRIDHVVLSHAHHDHVRDLAEFADLIIGNRQKPVQVHASPGTLEVLRSDLFNNRLWPDFFSLPNPDVPVLKATPLTVRKPFRIKGLTFRAFPVSHPIDAVGFVVRCPAGSFVYSGDTGPTFELWEAAARARNLELVMVETKFPNELQFVAEAAGHLTPRTLAGELEKLAAPDAKVVLYHVKPDCHRAVAKQVRALADGRISLMKIGDRYSI